MKNNPKIIKVNQQNILPINEAQVQKASEKIFEKI